MNMHNYVMVVSVWWSIVSRIQLWRVCKGYGQSEVGVLQGELTIHHVCGDGRIRATYGLAVPGLIQWAKVIDP